MRPDFIALVRATWQLVASLGVPVGLLFYRELFAIDPTLRRLFPDDLTPSAERLMNTLSDAIASLDRLDTIASALEAVGRRHAGYGVRDHDYDTASRALLATLRLTFGDRLSADAERAWADSYATVTGIVRRAGAESIAERREAVARAAAVAAA